MTATNDREPEAKGAASAPQKERKPMSYVSDNQDPEVYVCHANGAVTRVDMHGGPAENPAAEHARKLEQLRRLDPAAYNTVVTLLERETVRLSGARPPAPSGPRMPTRETEREKMTRLCGSAPGEIEAWEAARLSDEKLVATIPKSELALLRSLVGSDTKALAARWRETLASTKPGERAVARLSMPIDGSR
jgi:hypothetical protein